MSSSTRPDGSTTSSRPAWLRSADEVATALGVRARTGLSAGEAAQRLLDDGPNRLEEAEAVPAWRQLARHFTDPLVLLLIGAIAVSTIAWLLDGAADVPVEPIVISAIVIANGLLGYLQERGAERAVAALQRMASPSAHVVRDGEVRTIRADDVVVGDVIELGEGDAIPADGRVIDAARLTVAEAPLTGESVPVVKDASALDGEPPLGDRLNMVYRGTAVVRGRGRAIVTATGMRTEVGRIASLLGSGQPQPTPLQREIARVGRLLGASVIVIAIVVVATIIATAEVSGATELVDVLIIGVSLAVAAVPEGLPAVLTVILAVGVRRLARQRAIVKRLASVETLGSASVICSDKTGTLTRNEMTIQKVVTHSGTVTFGGTGYRPEGSVKAEGMPLGPGALRSEVRAVLGGGSLAGNATLRSADGEWTIHGDPTEAAFLVAERKLGTAEGRIERFTRLAEVPFSSERRLMSTVEADAERGEVAIMTKGAPGVLLERCSHERVGTSTEPLTDARRATVRAEVDRLADAGLRTLAVAYRPLATAEASDPATPGEGLERDLVLAGVAGMLDLPRSEAADAVSEARGAGIRVVMITGDHALTAARIATDLGILDSGGAVLDGAELAELDDEELLRAAREISVYARVAPEHKLRIVRALQADGAVVAMTGDGVNDAPALSAADIGVAMGIAGTDVSRDAADMILVDDNFATIVTAVREGRAIFANIRTSLRYLLGSNAGEVLTMFVGVIGAGLIGLNSDGAALAPLLATQILWINLLTDSAPALALGFEPPAPDVMRQRPRRGTERAIDATMATGVILTGVVMAAVTLLAMDLVLPGGLLSGSGTLELARTMGFTVLVVAQLFNALNARSERESAFDRPFANPRLWGAIGLSFGLQVMVVHVEWLNTAFGTTPLSLAEWATCIGLASAVLWAAELRKVLARARGSVMLSR